MYHRKVVLKLKNGSQIKLTNGDQQVSEVNVLTGFFADKVLGVVWNIT